MSMKFDISRDDMLRSKVIKPGVYLVTIESITQGPGTNDPQSITTTVNLKVKDGPDRNAIGVPIRTWFSEKAAGMAVEFLEAVTKTKIPEDGAGFDMEMAVGREVKAYVGNVKYNGRMQNRVEGWMPV